MKTYVSKGIICLDMNGIRFRIADIIYRYQDDDDYSYTFIPCYPVIDIISRFEVFQGIPGLNLDLRKTEYHRNNMQPVFINERVPMKNRIDFYQLFHKVGLDYFEPIKYLIRTDEKYSGDDFYVIEHFSPRNVEITLNGSKKNNHTIIKETLDAIAIGDTIKFGNLIIDDTNRKLVFDILYTLYMRSLNNLNTKRSEGIKLAKNEHRYKGRKPIVVDELLFSDYLEKVNDNQMTSKEAADKLNISIYKYYRLRKELKN